jgi:hypothetical protein
MKQTPARHFRLSSKTRRAAASLYQAAEVLSGSTDPRQVLAVLTAATEAARIIARKKHGPNGEAAAAIVSAFIQQPKRKAA